MTERRGVSRRAVLAGGGLAGGALLGGDAVRTARAGPEQAGIVTPVLPFLQIAAFDVVTAERTGLVSLLRTWTRVAADVVAASGVPVTVTFGFGPRLFAPGRFGLDGHRPPALAELPAFPRDALDPAASGGDLCVQVCAAHPTPAHQVVRTLVNFGRAEARLRWRQNGFRDAGAADPVGLFGFRDGTANLDVHDPAVTAEHLWVSDGPGWLHGGTYLVVRKIRLILDTWDRTALGDQEAVIGRRRDSNAKFDAPVDAHVRLAAPAANGGVRLLRRPYSYDAGADVNGLIDAGILFVCFQRDPGRQFAAIQRKLAASDLLNSFSQHVASGLFAVPPAAPPGSFVGAALFA